MLITLDNDLHISSAQVPGKAIDSFAQSPLCLAPAHSALSDLLRAKAAIAVWGKQKQKK